MASAGVASNPADAASSSKAPILERGSRKVGLVDAPEPEAFPSLVKKAVKRSYDMFVGQFGLRIAEEEQAVQLKVRMKLNDEYAHIPEMTTPAGRAGTGKEERAPAGGGSLVTRMLEDIDAKKKAADRSAAAAASSSTALQVAGSNATVPGGATGKKPATAGQSQIKEYSSSAYLSSNQLSTLALKGDMNDVPPVWHPPWKLMRVLIGHLGWVRCLAVDPSNEWFATGGNDKLIKIWDLASGTLKLTLTGHINTIRALEVSTRHPYLFSVGEDHTVKCWDLEYNKVIRNYHGHLSGVYSLALHPAIDVLATGGRDATVRLWDMRTRAQIHVLAGHTSTVMSLISQAKEPQLCSGSMDNQVRLWDIAAGKCSVVLTNHKKSIRSMAYHPSEYSFLTAGADKLKVWTGEFGAFERNLDPANAIINSVAIKDDPAGSIAVAGTDQGQLMSWDWKSGHRLSTVEAKTLSSAA
eukprot:GHVU01070869.1.p1 GENE.GHVU01070869.1~~GHVU01070869.1.p1  ORF type:complete len:468 (+),score=66.80 GHVU01070869.1:167-1570(+)